MIDHVLRFTLPAALSLLPRALNTPAAQALVLAIGLQESRFLERRQMEGGPARGFWQFEKAGIRGVMLHEKTCDPLEAALRALRYQQALTSVNYLHSIIEDNDTVAALFARLLVYTLPAPLPLRDNVQGAWLQYTDGWRPGKPVRRTWDDCYAEAWDRVESYR